MHSSSGLLQCFNMMGTIGRESCAVLMRRRRRSQHSCIGTVAFLYIEKTAMSLLGRAVSQ